MTEQELDRLARRYVRRLITGEFAHRRTREILTEASSQEPTAYECVMAFADAVRRVTARAASTPQP
jgi:hypothetical protein